MSTQRDPNSALARLISEAGFSNTSLASRVKTEAARRGLSIAADHVAVRRWIDGQRPHDDTIRCIVAVLSSKLGREVSPADIGFELRRRPMPGDALADSARYPGSANTAVTLLDSLASADMTDSPEIARASWVSDAASSAITGYLFSSTVWRDNVTIVGPTGKSADRIRAFTRHLMDLDFQFGGGHVRQLLLFYFRKEIVPLLRQSHPDGVKREIFSAAAETAQLLGWSAYDAGRHGPGQRYLTQALRLAQESGDVALGSWILSSLSHQANYLGRYNEALQFARAAQTSAGNQTTPTVNSVLLAMEARALASIGDSVGCAQVLHRAELEFDRRNPEKDPAWVSYFDSLELAGEAAHCFRDLGQPRETQLFGAQAVDPVETPPRTQAFINMVNAAGALKAGNLDEALSLATSAVDLTGSLQSSRYIRYLTDFHHSLTESHSNDIPVIQFTELLMGAYPDLKLR